MPSYQRAWTHELLESAQRNVGELSLLETASTGVYPQLTNSAGLKKLRINLDAAPQAAFRPTYALRVKREDLTLAEDPSSLSSSTAGGLHVPARRGKKGGSSAPASSCEDVSASEATTPPTTSATAKGALTRSHAHHSTAGDVLVEWVEYDREEVDERVAHLRRLDDLARVMHSASSRHPDLHGMDCLGYTDDSARSRYGLVYRAPAGSHSSLAELLGAGDMRTPDLDDRVALAATLAVAAWSLHSLDWLHKSLCSSNVLFFPSAAAAAAQRATSSDAMAPVLDAPRLTGFDASRPDLDTALSVVPRNPSIADLHRHPDSLRGLPYSKAYDVYSLGLLLLEIGLWKPLAHYHKSHYSPDRWRRRVVTPVLVPALASKCGKRYRDVVDDCINVDPHLSSKDAAKLMENVVARLEAIRL